jgi:hypothetical protein
MKLLNKILPIILVLVLSYWSIKSLLHPGFFPMHDDTQVARVHQMHQSLTDGMFPVRWVADLGYGYGYPIFNFYAPLAYYVGAVFIFAGFDALNATKIMIALGTLLSGVFMYFLAREFWGRAGGIVSALLYVYAPYHALNIYVRGAIGELWGYAFVPLGFYSIYKIYLSIESYIDLQNNSKFKIQNSKLQLKIKKEIWFYISLSAISYAAIILSHNLTAMMVSPFIVVFAFFLYIKLRFQKYLHKPYFVFLGLLLGLMLSAFYWLPVPVEMKYTNVLSVVGGGSDFRDHFVCVSQLWDSPWGFAGSAPGCIDGFSLKIGKIHVLLGLSSIVVLLYLFRQEKTKFQFFLFFLVSLLFSVFLTLEGSRFIWDLIPPMTFFQFPWRFLVMVVFLMSFIGGGSVWAVEKFLDSRKLNRAFSLVFVSVVSLAIILLDSDVFKPQTIINKTSDEYTSERTIKWETSKISDEYMPPNFLKPFGPAGIQNSRFVPNKSVTILSFMEETDEINAKVLATASAELGVNLAYFPGWHVYIDGAQEWFRYSGEGLLIDLPEGEHTVSIKFSQTPIEKAGNAVSVAGILILLIGIIYSRKK